MSSAPDTDWVVRLTDVDPDGFSRYLCDGILRARYRTSPMQPSLLTPHQVYAFTVDLWATANTFQAGHRIRVAVTSSNFPRFYRNLNSGGPFGQEAAGQPASTRCFTTAYARRVSFCRLWGSAWERRHPWRQGEEQPRSSTFAKSRTSEEYPVRISEVGAHGALFLLPTLRQDRQSRGILSDTVA